MSLSIKTSVSPSLPRPYRLVIRCVSTDSWTSLQVNSDRETTLRQLKEQALVSLGLFRPNKRASSSSDDAPILTSSVEQAVERPTTSSGAYGISVTRDVTTEEHATPARVHLVGAAEQDHRRLVREAEQWQLYSPCGGHWLDHSGEKRVIDACCDDELLFLFRRGAFLPVGLDDLVYLKLEVLQLRSNSTHSLDDEGLPEGAPEGQWRDRWLLLSGNKTYLQSNYRDAKPMQTFSGPPRSTAIAPAYTTHASGSLDPRISPSRDVLILSFGSVASVATAVILRGRSEDDFAHLVRALGPGGLATSVATGGGDNWALRELAWRRRVVQRAVASSREMGLMPSFVEGRDRSSSRPPSPSHAPDSIEDVILPPLHFPSSSASATVRPRSATTLDDNRLDRFLSDLASYDHPSSPGSSTASSPPSSGGLIVPARTRSLTYSPTMMAFSTSPPSSGAMSPKSLPPRLGDDEVEGEEEMVLTPSSEALFGSVGVRAVGGRRLPS